MAGVMWVQWYATVLRQEAFALSVAEVAPIADDPVVTVEVLRTVLSVSPLEVDSARIPAPAAADGRAGVTLPRPGIDGP